MSVAEAQYFALLRSALWGIPVVLEGEVNWEAIMKIAKHHATSVLLCGEAFKMTKSDYPPASMLVDMQSAMRLNLINHLKLKQILVSAVKLLREHNIEPVLLKGFGLAMLYPNPSLRQFGDIDLYLGLDHFHEACKLLRTLPGGYNWREEGDTGRHYNIEFGPYPMEIHRVSIDLLDPKEASVYESIEREGLFEKAQRIDFEGFELSIPSVDFMVFHTFFHAWHHFLTTGVGWRQVSDLAVTLHAYHKQLDFDKLYQWIVAMHLLKPWQVFGSLMVDYLGLPEAEMPFHKTSNHRRARKLFDRIMAEGNFRRPNHFKRNRPQGTVMRKLHAFIGIFVDFFQLAEVFPGSAFREMHAALKRNLWKKNQKK